MTLGLMVAPGPGKAQVAESYIYDVHGRLTGTTELSSAGAVSFSGYNFDAADNITLRSARNFAVPATPGQLHVNEYVVRQQTISSPNNAVTLTLQVDGNLVLVCSGTTLWSSGSSGSQAQFLVMQGDGHLVLYGPNYTPVWWTGVFGFSNAELRVQNDGNMVVYAGGIARWATGTSCPSTEVTSITFTASSNYAGYTGLTTANGMRDANFYNSNSVHGTNHEVSAVIRADLGSIKAISRIDIASLDATAPGGWGPAYINGAIVERSTDGVSWTGVGTVSGVVDGVYKSISLGGANLRYVRLRMVSNWLGMGDFRVYQ